MVRASGGCTIHAGGESTRLVLAVLGDRLNEWNLHQTLWGHKNEYMAASKCKLHTDDNDKQNLLADERPLVSPTTG